MSHQSAALTILCLGDSITHGSGSSNISSASYPAKLEQLLRSKAINVSEVLNLGVKGAAAQKNSPISYWRTWAFAAAKDRLNVSTLIFQLGSNDGVYRVWNEAAYIRDYREMISVMQENSPFAEVFISIPPPIYGQYAATKINTTVINHLLPGIVRQVAEAVGGHVIDLHAALGGSMLSKPNHFVRDGVHPNDLGYTVIASTVAAALLEYL